MELAELDAKIAQAGDRALAMEVETFEAWRARPSPIWPPPLQAAAEALAELDVAAALAEWADEAGAVRPVVDGSLLFEAEAGRHPVVEAAVTPRRRSLSRPTTAAWTAPGAGCARLSIVTGPNMAGKSTFLRQNALLAVLAQAGCLRARQAPCGWAWSTGCSAASAPATTWPAAAPPS